MDTNQIPEGWWLNVTLMARYEESWIVGVIRKGKSSWITEAAFGDLNSSEEAYKIGMDFIKEYKEKRK